MPRFSGSSQAMLLQHASRESFTNSGSGSATLVGANTSIASQERLIQPKESYSYMHRGPSINNDSTRSSRSTEDPPASMVRKVPKKTSSLNCNLMQPEGIPRIVSDGYVPEKCVDSTPRRPARRRGVRAAETGRGDLLPSYTTQQTNRARTGSLSNLIQSPFKSSAESHPAVARSLRIRKRTVNSDDEGNVIVGERSQMGYSGYQRHSWPGQHEEDFSHSKGDHRPRHRSFVSLLPGEKRWVNMKSSQCVVLVLLFCVACFTAGSYHRVFEATAQLETVQREESLLLLHLHKVEEQLIELHDNLRRLTDRTDGSPVMNGGPQRLSVDSDLLDVQMRKLREMEAELDHEVRSLQNRLSETAKQSIVSNFGEGAVQVDLDISFGDEKDNALMSNTISIRLWHDTPHTAWTFLQQVQNGGWNGAKFSVYHGRALLVQTENGGEVAPQVDFIERSLRGHDRYTVGLTDNGIILNIQDNRDYFKKEASVGVITSGFDTLRQIVTEVEGSHSENAMIKRASVSHLRKEQGAV